MGNTTAMVNIGNFYRDGLGVEQDGAKAIEWYEKAVEAGDSKVYSLIGYMYYEGNGVEQDSEKGMEWYEKYDEAISE